MINFCIFSGFLLYCILTAFLESENEGARIVVADILLVALIIFAFLLVLRKGNLFLGKNFKSIIPFFIISLIGIGFSVFPDRAAIEFLAIFLGFLGSIGLVNLLIRLPAEWLSKIFSFYVLSIGFLSFICILDFLLFPGIISSRNIGGLQGPFRNTGQAGSFFGVHAAICLALVLSGLVPKSPFHLLFALCVAVALALTLKRSSMIGFGIGLFGLFIQNLFFAAKGQKKFFGFFIFSALGILAAVFLFSWATENVSDMTARLDAKFSQRGIDTFDDFWGQNLDSSITAFLDSPLIGVGLGNVVDVYQEHEIHSTYLGVLAYNGIFGVITYLFFMCSVLRDIFLMSRRWSSNIYASFLFYIFPFFLGLMISWVYTSHLRKREFWILMTFIIVNSFFAKKIYRNNFN